MGCREERATGSPSGWLIHTPVGQPRGAVSRVLSRMEPFPLLRRGPRPFGRSDSCSQRDDWEDRLSRPAGGTATTMEYNAAGSLVKETTGADVTYYVWGADEMLDAAQLPDESWNYFSYDGDQRRWQKTDTDGTKRYRWNAGTSGKPGLAVVQEADDSDDTTAQYTHDQGVTIMPGRRSRSSVPPAPQSPQGRARSPRVGRRGARSRQHRAAPPPTVSRGATYDLDAFGVLRGSTGAFTTPYLFTGKERDPGPGLDYFIARQYEPTLGVFLSKDPIPTPTWMYSYAHQRPLSAWDPEGLERCGGQDCNDLEQDMTFTRHEVHSRKAFMCPSGRSGTLYEVYAFRTTRRSRYRCEVLEVWPFWRRAQCVLDGFDLIEESAPLGLVHTWCDDDPCSCNRVQQCEEAYAEQVGSLVQELLRRAVERLGLGPLEDALRKKGFESLEQFTAYLADLFARKAAEAGSNALAQCGRAFGLLSKAVPVIALIYEILRSLVELYEDWLYFQDLMESIDNQKDILQRCYRKQREAQWRVCPTCGPGPHGPVGPFPPDPYSDPYGHRPSGT